MTTTPTGRNSATAFPPDVQHKLQMQGIFLGSPGDGLRSCLMFPGHGAQYPRMLDGLAERYPVVDDAFRRVDATYGELTGRSLTGLVFSDDAASELEDPEVMQPSIFAASIALHRLVVELGAEPEVLVGHSLGEISALVAAGSLSLEEGVVAVHGRGVAVKAIEPEDRGGMLSVQTDDDQARHRLERLLVIAGTGDLRVTRSLVNSPAQTVLSGHGGALDEFAARCREAGLETTRLPVSHGFHSELLAPAVPVLEKTLASLNWRLPQVPVLSTVFGDYYGEDDVARIPALLARQLVTPFSFQDMVTRIHDRGVRAFVEVGPKPILSGLVQRILDGRDAVSVPTNVHSVGAVESVRRFITFAQVHGLWQGQRAEVSESAQRVDVAEPANAGPTSEAVTVDADALLKVVARHTGYPAALLGVGKRMAGDLGFSSRVRADIVRALGEHLGVGVDACTVEGDITLGDLFDQVAALPTATAPVEDTVEEAAPQVRRRWPVGMCPRSVVWCWRRLRRRRVIRWSCWSWIWSLRLIWVLTR
ncbi:acyltransferase domain-containing protein [Saccharopolyspora spinosporotrichia]